MEPAAADERIINEILQTFDAFDWGYEQLDGATFRTGVATDAGAFVVLIRVTNHWVVATINPFVERPASGWGETALRVMAAANHAINMAKIGIDDEDDAFLTVELPSEGFERSHLYDAMAALSHYAEQLVLSILQASRIDTLNQG